MKITRKQFRALILESLMLEASEEEMKALAGIKFKVKDPIPGFAPNLYPDAVRGVVMPNGRVIITDEDQNDLLKLDPGEVPPSLHDLIKARKRKNNEVDLSDVEGYWQDTTNDEAFISVIQNPLGRRPNIQVYSYEEGASQPVTTQRINQASPNKLKGYKASIKGGLWQKLSKFPWMDEVESTEGEKQKKKNSSNVPGTSGKITYIQKAIGDKEDGEWNRGKKDNKETDDKWKEWLNANDKRHLNCIGFNGNQKLESGQEIDRNTLKKAFEDNDAGALAQVAGYKNSLTGVYKMVKDVVDLEEKEILNRSALYDLGGDKPDEDNRKEGEEDVSAEKVEAVKVASSPEAIAEVDKIKDPKRRKGWYRKTLERLDKMIDKAIEKNDQKAVKELRGRRKIFGKKAKEEGVKVAETSSGSSSGAMTYEAAVNAAEQYVSQQDNPALFGVGEGNSKAAAEISARTNIAQKIYGSKRTTSGNTTTTTTSGTLSNVDIVKKFPVIGNTQITMIVVAKAGEENLKRIQEATLSRGSLYRRRYYGRY